MILCGVVVLIGVLFFAIINYYGWQTKLKYPNTDYVPNQTPSRKLDFSLVGSSKYDPSVHNIGKGYHLSYGNGWAIMSIDDFIVEGTLVKWVHIRDNEAMKLIADANKFTNSFNINFSQNDIIVSFGREITEMQCYNDGRYTAGRDDLKDLEVLAVTYSESHHGSKVFIYQIPKTYIVYYELDSPYYFDGKWGSGMDDLGTVIDLEHMRKAGVEPGK